ncbi:hypothetical protein [Klebsiella phage IME184]|uniref:Uncharacterized protein n=1 Tax=Klebsiella phage IME184 TaxID=2860373 RepID=A0AC61NKR0_9CAUD|nr:hypothetical protein [Klebsiella phage IME184]
MLAGLLGLLVSASKKREQKEAQREANHVSDDPADWFADHFRVRDGVTETPSKTDADGSV